MHNTPDRNTGEIRWLLFWPEVPAGNNPYWTDATPAAQELIAACLRQLDEWGVAGQDAGVVYLATVADLLRQAEPPMPDVTLRRSVGINGTRLSAIHNETEVGYIELEILDGGERLSRHGKWADLGNLQVTQALRRHGVATWLLAQAADWPQLAQAERLLAYAWLDGQDDTGQSYDDYRAFLAAAGFRELTRTRRGWVRTITLVVAYASVQECHCPLAMWTPCTEGGTMSVVTIAEAWPAAGRPSP
jgi:GNAT superfamily N-acetyltransferase